MDGSPAREVTIARNKSARVEGVGEISYNQFYPDFNIRQQTPSSLSGEYNNPAVQLQVKAPGGEIRPTLAFNSSLADQFYSSVGKEELDSLLIAGNKAILKNFEKVAISHTLTVQYDPGREPVYAGFFLLLISLAGVFFFSHQRVWALIRPADKGLSICFGGDTNRHKEVFHDRFTKLANPVEGKERDRQ
jgi:cytochrome c biogenesis protein